MIALLCIVWVIAFIAGDYSRGRFERHYWKKNRYCGVCNRLSSRLERVFDGTEREDGR